MFLCACAIDCFSPFSCSTCSRAYNVVITSFCNVIECRTFAIGAVGVDVALLIDEAHTAVAAF